MLKPWQTLTLLATSQAEGDGSARVPSTPTVAEAGGQQHAPRASPPQPQAARPVPAHTFRVRRCELYRVADMSCDLCRVSLLWQTCCIEAACST